MRFPGALALSTNNEADYVPLNVSFGEATVFRNNGTSYAVVSEPASMTMVGAGAVFLGGFAYLRRRRRA